MKQNDGKKQNTKKNIIVRDVESKTEGIFRFAYVKVNIEFNLLYKS
jgi:hypothetical protein